MTFERFWIQNYVVEKPLGKNKKTIGLIKDKLGKMIMEGFTYLSPETCTYLTNDGSGDTKAKGTKNCIIEQRFKFGSLSISCWRERECFSYM